jgi:hypothetical protein
MIDTCVAAQTMTSGRRHAHRRRRATAPTATQVD